MVVLVLRLTSKSTLNGWHSNFIRFRGSICGSILDHCLTSHIYAEYFKSIFDVNFSKDDPPRRKKEEAAYIYFMDFIEECEGELQ